METGTYSTISLAQVVASAKMQLRLETSDEDIWLEKLANEGCRHLDSLSIFIKRQCTLDIHDLKAKLPNGFYRILGLKLNGNNNCAGLIYVDQPFLSVCGCPNSTFADTVVGSGVFQIQNGYIVFSTAINTLDCEGQIIPATSCEIAFIGLHVDENGLMCVQSDMERGLVAYVCYMYMLQNSDKYSQWQMSEHKTTWIAQKSWIQGIAMQNKFYDTKRQIASIANAWIVDKNWSI
jgi:hypothetical protein